jgi:hypothetical protein
VGPCSFFPAARAIERGVKVRPYRRGGWEVDVTVRPVAERVAMARAEQGGGLVEIGGRPIWRRSRAASAAARCAPTQEGGAHTRTLRAAFSRRLRTREPAETQRTQDGAAFSFTSCALRMNSPNCCNVVSSSRIGHFRPPTGQPGAPDRRRRWKLRAGQRLSIRPRGARLRCNGRPLNCQLSKPAISIGDLSTRGSCKLTSSRPVTSSRRLSCWRSSAAT